MSGPIALFDKSFIEMLSLDEATVFDVLYGSVISPIFYAEVLADLSKAPRDERTVERLVADVARKTPVLHGGTTNDHYTSAFAVLADAAQGRRTTRRPAHSGRDTFAGKHTRGAAPPPRAVRCRTVSILR